MATFHARDFDMARLEPATRAYAARVAGVQRDAEAAALALGAPGAWERFHIRNRGRFYHPRYFVTAAFPALTALGPGSRLLEVGCGNGSNAPLLEQLPHTQVFMSDVAPAALDACAAQPLVAAAGARAQLFLWDVATGAAPAAPSPAAAMTRGAAPTPLAASTSAALSPPHAWPSQPPAAMAGGMNAAVCMFVLSALHPRDHARAVASLAATLRPGGLLCVRDHGHGDCAELRVDADAGPAPALCAVADDAEAPEPAPAAAPFARKPRRRGVDGGGGERARILAPRLHERGDGTLAYFFTVEELKALLLAAGLVVDTCVYHTIARGNRKTGAMMERVFVHAEARRREEASGGGVG